MRLRYRHINTKVTIFWKHFRHGRVKYQTIRARNSTEGEYYSSILWLIERKINWKVFNIKILYRLLYQLRFDNYSMITILFIKFVSRTNKVKYINSMEIKFKIILYINKKKLVIYIRLLSTDIPFCLVKKTSS